MKKKFLFVLALPCFLFSCGDNNNSNPPTSIEEVSISFASSKYEVSPKQKVTIKENVAGVKYSFQGGTPEGVSLNEDTGEIDFDDTGSLIPEKVYIATVGTSQASTIISFKVSEDTPTISFTFGSDYVVDGDIVSAKSVSSTSQKEYAVSFSLASNVNGISIDPNTGKVSISDEVEDQTEFIVVATSKNTSIQKTFKALTKNIVKPKSKETIMEVNDKIDVSFVLDFNGNSIEDSTTKDNLSIILDETKVEDFSYDGNSHTITIPVNKIEHLGEGSHNVIVSTLRNRVNFNLVIASKIIYEASDLETIFEPNYDGEIPSFKEGSLQGYYVLGADIDLSLELKEGGALYHNGSKMLPIGAYEDGVFSIPFEGTFDGNGHKITSFAYKGDKAAVNGLFGCNKGTIKNLTLEGSIDNVKSWSGGLVGNNQGTIEGVICNISLPNEGQSATGVVASINHGLIKDCFSINENVKGYNEAGKNYQNAGIIVGLNDVDGLIENVYGVSSDSNSNLIGFSLNSEVSETSAGKKFGSYEQLLENDFSSFYSEYISIDEEGISNNVLFVSSNLAKFEFVSSLPSYLIKGNEYDLDMVILPSERKIEAMELVKFEIEGDSHGVSINGNKIDSSLLDANEVDITIKASLDFSSKHYEARKTIKAYSELSGVKIINDEEYFLSGTRIELKAANEQGLDVAPTFTLDKGVMGWKTIFFTIEGNYLYIQDDIPSYVTSVALKASMLGKESETKEFSIKQLHGLVASNQIHYENDDSDFEYELSENEVKDVKVEGVSLDPTSYSFSSNKLTIDKEALNLVDNVRKELVIYTDTYAYRAFATKVSRSKATLDSLKEEYGESNVTSISNLDEFRQYFLNSTNEATSLSSSKIYALTNDIDLSSISDFKPIGNASNNEIAFAGKLFGLGHTISNLTYSGGAYVYGTGLFYQVSGTISDLNLNNFNISIESGNYIGALAGSVADTASIYNVNAFNSEVLITSGDGFSVPNHGELFLGGLVGKTWSSQIDLSTYNGYSINLYGAKN